MASEQEKNKVRKAFLPSIGELALYLMVSLLILVIINSAPAIKANSKDSYVFLSSFVRDGVQHLLAPINNQRSSSWLTFLFWATIGAFTYVVVWISGSIIYAFHNDLPPLHGFLKPQGINSKLVWIGAIGRALVRVLALFAFLYWVYLIAVSIFPYASNLFLGNILSFSPMHIISALLSVVTLAAAFFIGTIFIRCVFLRDRIFTS